MEHYTDLAFRYIKMKKARSIITIFGVSISVMLLYIILNLGWSYVLNEREEIRRERDYEIVFLTENQEQIDAILADSYVKDATVGEYYAYDYYEPVTYANALYINTTNPYCMDRILDELTERYGVSGKLNQELAPTYLQGEDGEALQVLILIYFIIAYIFAIFGVGMIRNSIQLTLFEQVKDFGNLRCIGSTRKQMERVIFIQGAVLEAAGIIMGVTFGWIGSLLAGYMIEWENTGFHVLPIVFIVAAFLYDLYFAMKENAKLVTGMSPVAAIRGEYRIYIDRRSRRKQKLEMRKKSAKVQTKVLKQNDEVEYDYVKEIDEEKRKNGRIFGIEGAYAYKNLMRSPGRFFKVVTAMTFGVAAAIILSCGALAVMRYDSKIKDWFGYYPIYVMTFTEFSNDWESETFGGSFTKLNEEIKHLSKVREAKRIYMDEMLVTDYNRNIYAHYTDVFKESTEVDAFWEHLQQEADERIAKGEDATFWQAALMYRSVMSVMGYDEQDLERCRDELIAGTLDVSEDGILVVENGYVDATDYEDPLDNGSIKYIHTCDYKIGDQVEALDMAEYRARLKELTEPARVEYEEKERALGEQMEQAERDGDSETYEKLYDARNECAKEYGILRRNCMIELHEKMILEGHYHAYTVEGILRYDPNGTTFSNVPQFIVPAARFHEMVGREKDYFSGMRYHFARLALRQYKNVLENAENEEDWYLYDISGYPEYQDMLQSVRNVLIAAALISLFLVSMVILNYINNTASGIYMRRKEFAQLRVIGVSKKGLFKIVMLEGIIAAVISCVLGVALGSGISYGLIMWIFRYFRDVEFVFPWIPAIVSVVVSVLILCGAVYVPLRRMPMDVAAELTTAGE